MIASTISALSCRKIYTLTYLQKAGHDCPFNVVILSRLVLPPSNQKVNHLVCTNRNK